MKKTYKELTIEELVNAVRVYEECYEESGNEELLNKIYKIDEEIDKRYMEDEEVRSYIDDLGNEGIYGRVGNN